MAVDGAIDVSVFPFTPETKVGSFGQTKVLRESLQHLGIWDDEWTAAGLVERMDAAGVEAAMVCAAS